MSIRIASTAEWFRCIRGTSAEHHAALFKLVRMLSGDDRRPRPPISLPGRSAMPTAPPPASPSAIRQHRLWRWAPPREPKDADAREPYSREQLERMDTRFIERLERAIARGQEQPPCSTF
jgi:hypothetical protein